MKEKALLILLLILTTTLPALAAPTNTSGPWGIDAAGFKNLSTALASPKTVGKTVTVSKPMAINNKTVGGNRLVKVLQGGSVNPASGKVLTFTLESNFEAGEHAAIGGAGNVTGLKIVKAYWYGAKGDDITDDTIALQKTFDTGAGVIDLGSGAYRVARTAGVNDRWGVIIRNNNVTLKGDGAKIRRFNTDISTYALAYSPLFIGVPDSNVAAPVENVTVTGVTFVGEDTRHSSSGDYLNDGRNMIMVKNVKGIKIYNCKFSKIDSSSIYFQGPHEYDYANSTYYNTTKSYNASIIDNEFIAEPHAVAGRALIHAICMQGVDSCDVSHNRFEWCDNCVAGEGRYNLASDLETDTYIPTYAGWSLGAVKRSGRYWSFCHNRVKNSSEHAAYMAGMDVVVSDNQIWTTDPVICYGDQIKIRSRNAVVTGNNIINVRAAISVNEPSLNVLVANNNIVTLNETTGGIIDASSDTLSLFISQRPWFYVSGSPDYQPMQNIAIRGNQIKMPDTAAVGAEAGSAFRLYTAVSDTNFPQGQIQNVLIDGNSVKGHKIGLYLVNSLVRNISVTNNTFTAKAFTDSGFTAGTTLNTTCLFGVHYTSNPLSYVKFSGNTVRGTAYLFSDIGGTAAAGALDLPFGFSGNSLSYVKSIKTAAFKAVQAPNNFSYNSGNYFLDRAYSGTMIGNSLGDGASSNSYLRQFFNYDGTVLRFYVDDGGTYKSLN